MKKRKIGFSLFVVAILFFTFSFKFSLTGEVINQTYFNSLYIFQVLGLVFLFISIFLILSKKSLDYLMIPTGEGTQNLKRAKRAIKEWDKHHINDIAISGGGEAPLKDSERVAIYNILRKHHIKPKNIFLSEGKNSKENIDNFFKKLNIFGKEIKSLGIVSYPSHLDRFEEYIQEGKEKGKIPKDLELHKIPTKQTFKEFSYGYLAKIKDKYHLNNLNNSFIGQTIKKVMGD